jgi:hypothetical protein
MLGVQIRSQRYDMGSGEFPCNHRQPCNSFTATERQIRKNIHFLNSEGRRVHIGGPFPRNSS